MKIETYDQLGNYNSIWEEFEGDPLKQDLFRDELKKNPKRTTSEIKTIVRRKAIMKRSTFLLTEVKSAFALFIFIVGSIFSLYILFK